MCDIIYGRPLCNKKNWRGSEKAVNPVVIVAYVVNNV